MSKTLSAVWIAFLAICLPFLSSCSDDTPPDVSEYDVVGIWSDKEGHFLDMRSTEHLYEYTLIRFQDADYWVKRKLMYFFEPTSYLMLKEDEEGTMHIYKVVGVNEEELVMCWVSTPPIADLEGENKLEIFKVFFNHDYEVDPKLFETFKKVTPGELEEALGDIEILG